MARPIQAGSLASVIDLADNPPDHPLYSLTGDLQQPLVLYIARVPGSHDVFLTTMKPQQKVVTAQDVQSSLYYMHLDTSEDYKLLGCFEDSDHSSDHEDGRGKPATPISSGGIRRKPLPPSPMLGLGDHSAPRPEVSSYSQIYSNGLTGDPQAERKPFSQDNITRHRHIDVRPPLPDRRLLGPRPLNQRFLDLEPNIDLRRRSEQPAWTPPRSSPGPSSEDKYNVPMAPFRPLAASLKGLPTLNGVHSRFPPSKPAALPAAHTLDKEIEERSDIQDISLSLIRRYNNEQWNVGKILSKGTKTTVSGLGESSQEISIMTHGYSRFIDPIDSVAEQATSTTEKLDGSSDTHTPSVAAEEQHFFERHLQASRQATIRDQRHRSGSTDSKLIYQSTQPSLENPRHSYQSSDSTASHRSFTHGSPELKSGFKNAYILRSPWEGICEFTAGVAGRSFKCKHSYTSSNPRFGPGTHSAQVSELRFNLPSSKTLGSTGSKSVAPGSPREAKRSSLFLHQHRRSSPSFEPAPKVELEERLDLSLGQEHAGGGFGGKQAKLGKLIIENEGLQMLDLIVAANMALWWRVYERCT